MLYDAVTAAIATLQSELGAHGCDVEVIDVSDGVVRIRMLADEDT